SHRAHGEGGARAEPRRRGDHDAADVAVDAGGAGQVGPGDGGAASGAEPGGGGWFLSVRRRRKAGTQRKQRDQRNAEGEGCLTSASLDHSLAIEVATSENRTAI